MVVGTFLVKVTHRCWLDGFGATTVESPAAIVGAVAAFKQQRLCGILRT